MAKKLDILINCAGFVHSGKILDAEDDQFDFAVSLNIKSMFHSIKAAIPLMIKKGGGSIINVSSVVSSIIGAPNRCIYGTTKAAVIGLTRALARELGRDWIRVNSIGPTAVATEGTEEFFGDKLEQATKAIAEGQALKRTLSPDDLTGTILYLASDASKFVTGQTIMVDGGTVFL